MDYIYSKKIINQNNLIPRKISKKIINFINFSDEKFEKEKDLRMSRYILYDELCKTRKKFQKFKNGRGNSTSRNFYIYEFIKKNYPNFSLNYDAKTKRLDIPEINGIRISLSSLLFSNLRKEEKIFKFKSYFFTKIKKLFFDNNFKKPEQSEINRFYKLILDIKQNKEKLTIVTPCCPDYSKKKKGERYEFTFNSIENGPGLVAERLKENIRQIHEFMDEIGIEFEHYVSIGDFEAFGKNNQKRLGISENVYLKKVKKNQQEVHKLFNNFRCISNKTFTEVFSNKKSWILQVKKFKNYLALNQNNLNEIDKKFLKTILDSRLSLYKKWYGNLSTKEYTEILFDQAAEYASMGFLINKKFKNTLVLGADHYRMASFYKTGSKKTIVFYLKKNYIT
tara:strand:- start:1431 stop:2612 length:1182 start_codon:yes stop_codon:yes gene_type:complete